MTDHSTEPSPADPNAPRRASDKAEILRLFGPHLAVGALIVVLAALAVLYVTTRPGGKESAAAACPFARQSVARISPFAKGEVASLAPEKAPAPLPVIAFEGPDGKPTTLAAFRGKTVLLNLWATWCAPCRKEMPALDRLQAQLGGKDFEVLALNLDTRNLEKRKAFLDEIGAKSLAFYADPKADALQKLKASAKALGLPTTILIDAQGCALGVMQGPAEWDSPDAQALIKAAMGS